MTYRGPTLREKLAGIALTFAAVPLLILGLAVLAIGMVAVFIWWVVAKVLWVANGRPQARPDRSALRVTTFLRTFRDDANDGWSWDDFTSDRYGDPLLQALMDEFAALGPWCVSEERMDAFINEVDRLEAWEASMTDDELRLEYQRLSVTDTPGSP